VKLKVKICGMRDLVNIHEIAQLEADYIGFIYHAGSPRFVGIDFQAPTVDLRTKRVGVFVNQSTEFILNEADRNSLHVVQLHGHESPDDCSVIKSKGIEVIKAFSVDAEFDFRNTNGYQDVVDYFLFDTKTKNYGGSGVSFDWTILNRYAGAIPFFLSGGLSANNIQQVKSIMNPMLYAVDINSGVEDSPGIKNRQLVKDIIESLNHI
jgi:phosphoribosylanthranilate isomerase